jgi:hypothetical protein
MVAPPDRSIEHRGSKASPLLRLDHEPRDSPISEAPDLFRMSGEGPLCPSY